MQAANRILQTLKTEKPAFGLWQTFPGANLSRCLARTGVDWICIDCEHGNIDDAEMHNSVAAIAACGVSPIVRIPANESWMVKRALDTGAHGILVPLLRTPDDARRLVQAAKFPPQGQRGFGSPFPHHAFGVADQSQYLREANAGILTIVQIETREALAGVDEIARVDGVDVLLVGPFDLGNSIGEPILDGVMTDALHAAVDRVHQAALRNGKKTGIFCVSGEQANTYVERGFHMVTVTGDMIAIPATLGLQLKQARGEVKGSVNGGSGAVGMAYDGKVGGKS